MRWLINSNDSNQINLKGFIKFEFDFFTVFVEKKQSLLIPNDNQIIETDEKIFILSGLIIKPLDFLESFERTMIESNEIDKYKALFETLSKTWGSFTGLLIDKVERMIYGFNSHLGDNPFFRYEGEKNQIVCSNDLWLLVSVVKKKNISLLPEELAINQILKFGYIIDNKTLLKNIFKLNPGQIISISKSDISFEYYYKIDFVNKSSLSFTDLLNHANFLLKSSLKSIIDKSVLFDKPSFYVDISSGLDSRLINFVLKKIDSNIEVTNLHYSTSYSDEFKISNEISSYLNNNLLFSSMDYPRFIENHNETVRLNYGLSSFQSSTNMNLMSRILNTNDSSSIVINGQLGDVVLGSFLTLKDLDNNEINLEDKSLFNGFKNTGLSVDNYSNQEDFLFTCRGLQGTLSSHAIRLNYMFPISPYLAPDFLKFALAIPIRYRANHYFYFKFLREFYPESLLFRSNRFNLSSLSGRIKYYFYYGKGRLKRIAKKYKINFGNEKLFINKETMNPFETWFREYPHLREDLIKFVRINSSLINDLGFHHLLEDEYLMNNNLLFSIVTIVDFFKIVKEN
jgi:asparagine synthase (glutamine-hydrolysing)